MKQLIADLKAQLAATKCRTNATAALEARDTLAESVPALLDYIVDLETRIADDERIHNENADVFNRKCEEHQALLNYVEKLEAVVEAARNFDLAQTVHFDVTRGPGRQRVYEIDEERVKDLERALATLDTNLPQFTGSGKNVSKEKV